MPTLTYSTEAEAITNLPALSEISDLARYLYVAEWVIDQYVWYPLRDGRSRVFPLKTETEISYEVEMSVALIAEYVKNRESLGDPTQGGVIKGESGLERSLQYETNKKSFIISLVEWIPEQAKMLLEKYRQTGELSSFNLLGNVWSVIE